MASKQRRIRAATCRRTSVAEIEESPLPRYHRARHARLDTLLVRIHEVVPKPR
jgi:hypothetical protein